MENPGSTHATSMVDSATILAKERKGYFVTMNRKDKPYGKVHPRFSSAFWQELKEEWVLVDCNRNRHIVGYEKSKKSPLIKEGWSDLRHFYGMAGDHSINLEYKGDSQFQITVFKKPSTPASKSPHHCKQKLVSFMVTLTRYQAKGSQLNLAVEFQGFLRKCGFTTLQLNGPAGMSKNCSMLICNVPRRSVKIGKGWKNFCHGNLLKAGDEIVFQFSDVNSNVVNVKK